MRITDVEQYQTEELICIHQLYLTNKKNGANLGEFLRNSYVAQRTWSLDTHYEGFDDLSPQISFNITLPVWCCKEPGYEVDYAGVLFAFIDVTKPTL